MRRVLLLQSYPCDESVPYYKAHGIYLGTLGQEINVQTLGFPSSQCVLTRPNPIAFPSSQVIIHSGSSVIPVLVTRLKWREFSKLPTVWIEVEPPLQW